MVVGPRSQSEHAHSGSCCGRTQGLTIEWHEGRAEKLLFSDSNFDLVLCQFGLMLFTDRHTALTEMHRVLTKSGRVLLSVWQGLDRHPFYQTLHDMSQRRLGMSGVQDVFALGDADVLRRLLTDAGFQHVEIEPVSMTARFPNPEEFLAWEIDVNPAAIPALRHLDTQARQAIMAALREDMMVPLHEVIQDDHVVIPFHAHIARARR